MFFYGLVSWGCRIYRLHLCSGIRFPHPSNEWHDIYPPTKKKKRAQACLKMLSTKCLEIIYVYFGSISSLIHILLNIMDIFCLHICFVDPFILPYWFYNIWQELVDVSSIIIYFPKYFLPKVEQKVLEEINNCTVLCFAKSCWSKSFKK